MKCENCNADLIFTTGRPFTTEESRVRLENGVGLPMVTMCTCKHPTPLLRKHVKNKQEYDDFNEGRV